MTLARWLAAWPRYGKPHWRHHPWRPHRWELVIRPGLPRSVCRRPGCTFWKPPWA